MEQQKLPNATLILVFGIVSAVLGCCYGFGGLFGLIALFLSSKAKKQYKENPEEYSDYGNVKIGVILSIIGIILAVIFWGIMIWAISTFGLETLQDEERLREAIEEWNNQ
ncbi:MULTISPECIES: CCC motif membrane protein [Flavobacteriaceae]|uniref:CCC motif membrane protein n=1 Tax=Flavobacteriaceae TaxID=49546 RepID=UPI00149250B4|nr:MULTISPECIES: CCC motif membrane protein [Allomuricauda]MDC6367494.1 CCC motif membrane protein [Muricauda sp. AC10]